MVLIIPVIVIAVLAILMCRQESRRRKISFPLALLTCIVTTPLIGYFIIVPRPLRQPQGCKWCGNMDNEAAYCGICGKDAQGMVRPSGK